MNTYLNGHDWQTPQYAPAYQQLNLEELNYKKELENQSIVESRLNIASIMCFFVFCLVLYLIWYFTKEMDKWKVFFGIGIFLLICYVYRKYVTIGLLLMMVTPIVVMEPEQYNVTDLL